MSENTLDEELIDQKAETEQKIKQSQKLVQYAAIAALTLGIILVIGIFSQLYSENFRLTELWFLGGLSLLFLLVGLGARRYPIVLLSIACTIMAVIIMISIFFTYKDLNNALNTVIYFCWFFLFFLFGLIAAFRVKRLRASLGEH